MLKPISTALARLAAAGDADALEALRAAIAPRLGPIEGILRGRFGSENAARRALMAVIQKAAGALDVQEMSATELSPIAMTRLLLAIAAHIKPQETVPEPSMAAFAAKLDADHVLGGAGRDARVATPLSVYVDAAQLPIGEFVELLGSLSDLYRTLGGEGLVIRNVGTMQPALLPVGGSS